MRKTKFLIPILLLTLLGCEQNEFSVPVPALPSGGSYSAPSRSVPNSPKAPPAKGGQNFGSYTHDPDNPDAQPEDWDEPVVAASPEEAERICKQRAANYGVKFNRVQPPSRIRTGQNQTYRCWYTSNAIE